MMAAAAAVGVVVPGSGTWRLGIDHWCAVLMSASFPHKSSSRWATAGWLACSGGTGECWRQVPAPGPNADGSFPVPRTEWTSACGAFVCQRREAPTSSQTLRPADLRSRSRLCRQTRSFCAHRTAWFPYRRSPTYYPAVRSRRPMPIAAIINRSAATTTSFRAVYTTASSTFRSVSAQDYHLARPHARFNSHLVGHWLSRPLTSRSRRCLWPWSTTSAFGSSSALARSMASSTASERKARRVGDYPFVLDYRTRW